MLNKLLKTTLICLMFLFLSLNSSDADVPDTVTNVLSGLTTAKYYMDMADKNYDDVRFVMQKLINDWSINQDKVRKGRTVQLLSGGATLVSACVAVASGGSLAPAAYGVYVTSYYGNSTTRTAIASAAYLTTMEVVMNDLSLALWDVSTAYSGGFFPEYQNGVVIDYVPIKGYAAWYDEYLHAWAGHELVRFEQDSDGNYIRSAVYDSAQKIEEHYSLTGWYHKTVTRPSPSDMNHNIGKELLYKHYNSPDDVHNPNSYYWTTVGFPYAFECEGPCTYMFESPHEALKSHILVCGNDHHAVAFEIDGCGREYYKCPGHDVPVFHNIFRCTKHDKKFKDGDRVNVYCGKQFRPCTNYKIINGEDSSVVSPSGHCTKFFGAGNPGVHDHSSSDEPSSWETAYTDESNLVTDGENAPTLPSSENPGATPTDVAYTCGIHSGPAESESSDHKTTISGWSGSFYECQPHTNFACGHTDLIANATYHALQASCSLTNANGDSCALTNSYACQSHTCVYSCGRSGCSETVSSSTEHSATCASGHSYWTCKPSDVSLHRTRTCRLSTCGKSWERCSTPGGTPLCDDPGRRSRGLPCWKKE